MRIFITKIIGFVDTMRIFITNMYLKVKTSGTYDSFNVVAPKGLELFKMVREA